MIEMRDFVPAPIRAMRWRLPWMMATGSYARAPIRTAMRAARFTLGELSGRDITFRSAAGLVVTSMPNNFSSFAYCVDGARDAEIWRFIEKNVGPGGVFIDVGANIGTYAMPAAQLVGPSGHVVAFEAHPRTYRYLCRNVDLNMLRQVTALNIALGEEDGDLEMTFNAANPGETHVSAAPGMPGGKSVRVQVTRLDDALSAIGVTRVDYMKVDVEGFELPVLRGAERTFAENPGIAVQTELQERHAARYGHTIAEIGALMENFGLRPHHIDGAGEAVPVSGPLRGDVVWLRR